MNMDKYFMWIHYERLHNHNKAKHNKTVAVVFENVVMLPVDASMYMHFAAAILLSSALYIQCSNYRQTSNVRSA